MKIIGVGCGPGLLTEQAIKELRTARNVYGSDRAIALARPLLPASCRGKSIECAVVPTPFYRRAGLKQ